jgi:hypothetical protein
MLLTLARSAGLYGLATAAVLARRTAIALSLYALVGLLGLIGLGFLTAAAYLALMRDLGPVVAPLIVGCAYLAAALVALVAAQTRRRRW